MKVFCKKLHSDAILPTFGSIQSAGADLYSVETHEILPLERALVKTGIAVAIEETQECKAEIQIRPRSGLAYKKGITVLNTPGTIDEDYRGEIGVILFNTSNETVRIEKGERIAQAVLNVLPEAEYIEVEELDATERGAGGFGSTGK